jgi:DNA-binding transcriptional LysR family regulator
MTLNPDDPIGEVDLPLLLAFEALLAERNITRAARRLAITQPAMSARLGRLRRLFDDQLFVPARGSRGVVPTSRAVTLEPMLASALDSLRGLVRHERSFDPSTSERTFTVAMHDNPAMMLGAGLLAALRTRAPLCRLAMVTPGRETIAGELESGRVDILIATPDMIDESFLARVLLSEGFATAQRRDHPRGRAPLDLDSFCALDHLLVSADGGGFNGLVDERLAVLRRKRRVAASVQSYALAPFLLEASDLACTLPRRLLERFGDTLELFEPPLELSRFSLSMIWHRRSNDDQGHRWLREQLVAVAHVRT